MNSAILIPTYEYDLDQNVAFIKSVKSNGLDDNMPKIYFATSTDSESEQLLSIFEKEDLHELEFIEVFSLSSMVRKFDNYRLVNDGDSSINYHGGKYAFINAKKLTGLQRAFNDGADAVIVLDSEVIQFKEYSLRRFVDDAVTCDVYRYSLNAYKNEFISKIQHDSIRSVITKYDTSSFFSISYGWYDNICVYHKDVFCDFLNFMASGFIGNDEESMCVYVSAKLRGLSFEWVTYMAYRKFILNQVNNTENIDAIILMSTGTNPDAVPQTENIYRYLTGDKSLDRRILSNLNLRWVPYTEDPYILDILNTSTTSNCCLMFHTDRELNQPKLLTPPSQNKQDTSIIKRIVNRISLFGF